MRSLLVVAAVLCLPAVAGLPAIANAQGSKSCDELKTEIAAKLDAKGVKGYSLEIVKKDAEVTEGKVVGTCGGGTQKIIYNRNAKPAPAAPAQKKEPGNS